MKLLGLLMLLTLSYEAQALTCSSELNQGHKIKLDSQILESGTVIQGEYTALSTITNLFVGELLAAQSSFLTKVYKLFNQQGKEFSLTVSESLHPTPCRTRVCNGPFTVEHSIAKLSTKGEQDEYFKCL